MPTDKKGKYTPSNVVVRAAKGIGNAIGVRKKSDATKTREAKAIEQAQKVAQQLQKRQQAKAAYSAGTAPPSTKNQEKQANRKDEMRRQIKQNQKNGGRSM